MNNIFYYISLFLLLAIVILLTIYITKFNSNSYLTCRDIRNLEKQEKINNNLNNIYDFKISKEFNKMFTQSNILTQYQTFYNEDPNVHTQPRL